MMPYILEIGPLRIPSYGFMLMIAFMTNYFLLTRETKKLGKDPEIAGDLVFWAAIGGIGGSKVYYMIENFDAFSADPLAMIFSGSGLVFLGGLAGGMLAVTIYLRKKNEPWLMWADIVAPCLILGYAIGRIGCFLVGDDYGIPTNLPWGMSFPRGAPPTYQEVHPTQIYEAVLGLSIFFVLSRLRLKSKPLGSVFSFYLIFAGMERFLIEFIRTNEKYMLGLSGAQVISLIMVTTGIILLTQLGKFSDYDSAAGAEKLTPD
jgi:phosphatidylglycerol:prolipoprotein diacylglycerol transferase